MSGDGPGGRDRTGPPRQSPLSQIRRAQSRPPAAGGSAAAPPEPDERSERTIVAPLGGAGGGVRRAQGSPAAPRAPAPPPPEPDYEAPAGTSAFGDEPTAIGPQAPPLRRAQAADAALAPDFEPSFPLPPMAVRNPLVWLATRILVRLAGVRSGRLAVSTPDVHAEMAAAIGSYRDALADVGYDAGTRDAALYAVAATVDDVMQNIPASQGFQWARRSMVIQSFGENVGGDRFWTTVDDLLRRPSGREELIELHHACVAAGFLGRFRLANLSARDDPGVAGRMAAMNAELARVVARTGEPLSPQWRGVAAPVRRVGLTAPLLLALGLAACLALAVFAYFFFTLGERTDATASAMQNLHPRLQLVLIERNTPPSPAPQPQAEPTNTRVERIRGNLAPEIEAGAIDVTVKGGRIRIVTKLKDGNLFRSGSDVIDPDQIDFFRRAAEAMNQPDDDGFAIKIVGHTDSDRPRGGLRFGTNQELSEARAASAAAELNKHLTRQGRIVTEGKGDGDPVADNATPEGKARNRRIEIFAPFEGDAFGG